MSGLKTIEDIRKHLLELMPLASDEGAQMLAYLIHMAAVEAEDILAGKREIELPPRPSKVPR